MIENTPRERMLYCAVLVAATALFYVLNVLTPLKPDDVMYALQMHNLHERIDGWLSLLHSQAYHYVDTNGRVASSFLVQLFCGLLGKPLFNVVNALVTALFAHLAATLVSGCRHSVLALSMVLAWMMTLMPVPGETMLWVSGAVNYLWAATATLSLLVWLQSDRSRRPSPWWQHIVVLLLAMLAGSMNESVTAGTLLGLVVYFALNRSRFTGTTRSALLGYALGVALIFASPAAWQRLTGGGDVNLHISAMQMLSRRLINTCTKSLHFVAPALVLAGVVVALARKRFATLRGHILLWCFAGVLMAIAALSITNSYRSYTAFALFSFIVVAQWFHRLLDMRRAAPWVAAILLLGSAALAVPALRAINTYKHYDDAVTTAIAGAPRECVLPASQPPVTSRWVYPVTYDNDGYMTHKYYYCCYYGKDNLQFLAPDIYARYSSGDMMTGGSKAPFAVADSTAAGPLQLTVFDGHPYSIIDMGTNKPKLAAPQARVYYESMEQHLGAERSAKLKRWGEFPEFMPMSQYYLKQGDHYYLVLPEIERDVVAIEVPLTIDGKKTVLRFDKSTEPQP